MPEQLLRIGDLAERVGVATSAVRFYESKGLLEPDARVAGQRRYREPAVERLGLIALMRQAGLSIGDIATALDRDPARAADRRARAARRAVELREQVLSTLSALVVVEHASQCHRAADDDRCLDDIRRRREEALAQADEVLHRIVPPRVPA